LFSLFPAFLTNHFHKKKFVIFIFVQIVNNEVLSYFCKKIFFLLVGVKPFSSVYIGRKFFVAIGKKVIFTLKNSLEY